MGLGPVNDFRIDFLNLKPEMQDNFMDDHSDITKKSKRGLANMVNDLFDGNDAKFIETQVRKTLSKMDEKEI